jgi:DNA invertase Pin-like site-specific DNA recombinase
MFKMFLTTTQLEEKGTGFRSLQEAIGTTTSGSKLVFQIFGALAEFECNLIRERTQAELNGRSGQKKKRGKAQSAERSQNGIAV